MTSIPSSECHGCEFEKPVNNNSEYCGATKCSKVGGGVIVIEKNRYLTLKLTGELDDLRL